MGSGFTCATGFVKLLLKPVHLWSGNLVTFASQQHEDTQAPRILPSSRCSVARATFTKNSVGVLKVVWSPCLGKAPVASLRWELEYIEYISSIRVYFLSLLIYRLMRQWYDREQRGAQNDLGTLQGFVIAVRDALRLFRGGLMHGGHPCNGFPGFKHTAHHPTSTPIQPGAPIW